MPKLMQLDVDYNSPTNVGLLAGCASLTNLDLDGMRPR